MNKPFLKDSSTQTSVSACGITLDISRQRLTQWDLDDFIHYAEEVNLQDAFRRMYAGEVVNISENRHIETIRRIYKTMRCCR